MNVKILRKSEKEIEIEVDEETYTLANLLNNYLLRQSGVDSAFKVEHPLIPGFKMIIRTREKSPEEALKKALKDITYDIEELEKFVNLLNR
ncbi:MAG: RpoL/Rpb11 RNA polymerase subunit family protein [Thermoproteota archaeon]